MALAPVDLQALQSLCELNYRRLRQLMTEVGCSPLLSVAGGELSWRAHRLSPHTSRVDLCWQRAPRHLWPDTVWQLHMYHDAQMLEVHAVGRHARIRVRNAQPHPRGHGRDEKWQVNQFLGLLLSHALAHRQSWV